MSETLGEAAILTEIPEGCIPEHGITIVSYLNEDGEGMFAQTTHGEANHSTLIGLLTMAAHTLMHDANPTPCEEGEP